MIPVAFQLSTAIAVPASVTVLLPWVAPKLLPVIVIALPTGPDVGEMLVMLGGPVTVKLIPLLGSPETVTTMSPDVAPEGTVAMINAPLQLTTVIDVPASVTVLEPCVVPKLDPKMFTEVVTGPDVGDKLPICGPVGTHRL